MEHRHEVDTSAKLFVMSKSFFCLKMSEATKANLLPMAMLCNVRKKLIDISHWSLISLLVEQIAHALKFLRLIDREWRAQLSSSKSKNFLMFI